MSEVTVLPPHGFVKLVKWMGDELDVVNAARVSFHKEVTWDRERDGDEMKLFLGEKDKGLINFLLRERHGTPFEMGFMAQFHVRAPLAVFYEWHRHRIGFSYNEESGRYVELRPDFYHPAPEDIRTQVGKPGSYTFETIEDPSVRKYVDDSFDQVYFAAYHKYQRMIELGVAKELARFVLPVGIFKEQRVTCNARSLMSFLSLRNDPDTLREFRVYAAAMEEMFAQHMPNVHEAFVKHGRVSP